MDKPIIRTVGCFAVAVPFLLSLGCNRSDGHWESDQETKAPAVEEIVADDPAPVGNATPSRAAPGDAAPGYATPQECFAAFQQAIRADDTATMLGCLSPLDRKQRIGWYAYYVDREVFYDRKNADAAKALLAKHNIKEGAVIGHIHKDGESPIEQTIVDVTRVGASVERPIEFAVEASKLVTLTIGGLDSKRESRVKIKDFDIVGERAEATVVDPESGESNQIYFKKQDGSWLIATGT